jgi:rod shape-determining protein MreC
LKGVTRFRKIWIWLFFIGFALALLSSNFGRKRNWNMGEKLLIEVTAPLQSIIEQAINITRQFWLNYFYLVNTRQENELLTRELDRLKMENSRYRELQTSQKRLQELLRFKQTTNRPALAAQVIGLDPTGWFKSVIINKGEDAGVKLDLPVVNGSGVVGRVVSVSPNYAKVLLVIDQNSAIDCLIQRSRDRGMVKGLSAEICKLDYLARSGDVIEGDMVVTSGLGGIFPKGLPLGRVLKVNEVSGELFKDIQIKPAVDFSKLEEVLVILEEKKSQNLRRQE